MRHVLWRPLNKPLLSTVHFGMFWRQNWRQGLPQRPGLGTRFEELMKNSKLQEQKDRHLDFWGHFSLYPYELKPWSTAAVTYKLEFWKWSMTRKEWKNEARCKKVGKKLDGVKERREFSVLLFIITKEVHNRRKRQEKENLLILWRKEGKGKTFQGKFQGDDLLHKQQKQRLRIYVEGILMNKSVRMILRHILAVIQTQGVGNP